MTKYIKLTTTKKNRRILIQQPPCEGRQIRGKINDTFVDISLSIVYNVFLQLSSLSRDFSRLRKTTIQTF